MPEYIMMMMPSQSSGELLAGFIRREIETHGPVTIARFMEWSLYHPEYGYYTRGPNIGPKGDFLTSPETSPAFGQLLARHLAELDALLGEPAKFHIVECGPGRGTLAADILAALASHHPTLCQRCHYWLVEISPALRAEQKQRLLSGFGGYVSWATDLRELPSAVEGALIGNEFIDAFPVHVLENRDGAILEQYAGTGEAEAFELVYGEPSDARLKKFLARYRIELAPGERIEINLAGAEWFKQASRVFSRGLVTLIDYGDTQPARYSGARREGTLLGYYGGAVTHDILAHPGQQDITALVDFTALQDEAERAGFSLVGMTRQASFLVGLGLGTSLTVEGHTSDVTEALNYRRGLQTLVSMEGLGRFHVLLLSKGLDVRKATDSLSGLQYAGLL
ncbi:MAG TPA: SAM-dependent methyltransferase [Chloroflexia bacterium]